MSILTTSAFTAPNSALKASTTSGSFALSKTDRKEAWSLAMETQQSENWLRHGLTAHEYFIGINSQIYQRTISDDSSFMALRSDKKIDSADSSKFASENIKLDRSRNTSESQHSDVAMIISDDRRIGVISADRGVDLQKNMSVVSTVSLNNNLSEPLHALINSSNYFGIKPPFMQEHVIESVDLKQSVAVAKSLIWSATQFEEKVVAEFFVKPNSDRVSMSTIDNRIVKNGLQLSSGRVHSIDVNEKEIEADSVDVKSKLDSLVKDMSPPSSQDRMSFHTEISEQGVRIWLGVNERTHGDIANLISHLRTWLMTQGVPLLSLVCNGKAVQEDMFGKCDTEGWIKDVQQKTSSSLELPTNIATDHYVKIAEDLALIKL